MYQWLVIWLLALFPLLMIFETYLNDFWNDKSRNMFLQSKFCKLAVKCKKIFPFRNFFMHHQVFKKFYASFLRFLRISSANAAPEFEGRGGEELANDITSMLSRAYEDNNTLDMEKLCVAEGQHCWVLYVDILVRSLLQLW